MQEALRVGAALFNDGHYHAAHDAWEDRWLGLGKGSDDERFLHGLIQYTAAVYHLEQDNHEGARGLAQTAGEYLAALPPAYRDVNLDAIRETLASIAADTATVTPDEAVAITIDGDAVGLDDLGPSACWIAAEILAEDRAGFDPDVVREANELAESPHDRFATLVQDFVHRSAHRPLVYERLRQHVNRERSRRAGIDDVFETDDEA